MGAYDQELCSEEQGSIGLPTMIVSDLQGLSRQLFCEIGISGDLCSLGKVECIRPAHHGLDELLRQGAHGLDAAIHLLDVPTQEDGRGRCVRRKKSNTGSPRRLARTRASAVRARVSSSSDGAGDGKIT